jgi:hypothetical protein
MTITLERIGRRTYLRGDTYPIKDQLKGAGAHWDGEQRAWWIGDHGKAEEIATKAGGVAQGGSEERSGGGGDRLTADSKIAGKARYQGREYLLVWEGQTKRGYAAKLAFSDGSKTFWASKKEYQVTKRYEERTEGHGRYQRTRGGMTFGRLQQLREEFADERKQEKALGAKDGFVGERGEIVTRFDGSKNHRTPGYEIGDSRWIKHGGRLIACVVIGYELASYVSEETAEDMGHYDMKSGWYGYVHHRKATGVEADALFAREPRDGASMPVDNSGGMSAAMRADVSEVMSEDNA